MKTLLAPLANSLAKPGWRSGYRAGLEIQNSTEVGKPASGPLARRGSSPFPGAVFSQRFVVILTKCVCFSLIDNALTVNHHLKDNFY
jgi:hypothetical protein